ncbi:tetratricopeptide repeat protein [Candidatus Uabimicrobium sp. HlEnr_7]|uniref:tetratricopeptide repeat protein n=1 Tax=Candidatus Uabimicrobium helgolandensis TaxID=3095367 RepID=UPI00355834E3
MNELIKFYFSAISHYYVGNNFTLARQECYKAIDFSVHNKEIVSLLRSLKTRPHSPFESFRSLKIIEQLDKEDLDNFLVLFLSEHHAESIIFRKVNWELLQENFTPNSVKHRMWSHIFERDWRYALQSAESLLLPIQGDPVVYFQLATIYFHVRYFSQAEKYLFALGQYGGIYTTAAISLLLQLPQRNFKTLAKSHLLVKYSHPLSSPEKLVIADILQKSWDQEAFFAYAKYLFKCGSCSYVDLASLYACGGHWSYAAKCCYAISKPEPKDIERMILIFLDSSSETIKSKTVSKFFGWLISVNKDMYSVFSLNKFLQKLLPKLALKGYKKFQKENESESLLGQSICYFYLQQYSKSKKILQQTQDKYPELEGQIIEWNARINVKENSKETLDSLCKNAKKFPLQNVLTDLCKSTCPVCNYYQENLEICLRCGYRVSNIFSWTKNHLRFQGEKLYFPKEFILITSSALIYKKNDVAVFIVFSSRSLSMVFEIKKNGEEYSTSNIKIEGIGIVKQTLTDTGIYEATVRTKDTESLITTLVASDAEDLKVTCVAQKWVSGTLQVTFSALDAWGYATEETPEVVLFDIYTQKRNVADSIQLKNNQIRCVWNCLSLITPYAYAFVTISDKSWVVAIKTEKTASWRKIQDKFCENLAKVGYKYNITEKKLDIDVNKEREEISLVTQPLGQDLLDIYRRNNTSILDICLPKFISGAYFSATRFAKGFTQERGEEVVFPMLSIPPKLVIGFPEIVEPNLKFSVDIDSCFQGEVYIFSRDKNILFHSLKDQLLMRDNTLSMPPFEVLASGMLPTNLNANEHYSSYLGRYKFEESLQVELKAMPIEGIQKFTFFASDGHFFTEKTIAVRIENSTTISGDFPSKIGEKDFYEVPVGFCSQIILPFTISSEGEGIIEQGEQNTTVIKVSRPDVFTLKLGNKQQVHKVESLLVHQDTCSIFERVTPDNITPDVRVYRNGYSVISEIARELNRDKFLGLDHVAAKLYGLAVLYKFSTESKIEKANDEYERSIFLLQQELNLQKINFRKQPELVLSTLLYLSIYMEIPKFKEVKDIAVRLQQQCRENNLVDNRLLFLSLDFRQKIRCPISAAGGILHDVNVKKAIRYLEKNVQQGPKWCRKNFKDDITCTVWVANALYHCNHSLAKDTLKYINDKWQNGSLGNIHADIAYMKLMYAMTKKDEQVSWQRKNTVVEHQALSDVVQSKFSIRMLETNVLKPGKNFTLRANIKKIKYPKISLYTPGNIVVRDPKTGNFRSGNIDWPVSTNDLEIKCKALLCGVGTLYVVVEEMNKRSYKIYDSYQLVVV